MAINQYFNNYNNYEEQSLIDQLVIESIQIKGIDFKYIPRTDSNVDYLFLEDKNASYNDYTTIEMYIRNVEGFDGSRELISNYGLEIKDSAVIDVSKTRFKQEFPDLIRPQEGDLLFMPITNTLLEIKFVNHEDPFFQHGSQYIYSLRCETFEHSYEDIATGDVEVDDLVNDTLQSILDLENDTNVYGDNSDIQTETDTFTDFDPSNPFGVR